MHDERHAGKVSCARDDRVVFVLVHMDQFSAGPSNSPRQFHNRRKEWRWTPPIEEVPDRVLIHRDFRTSQGRQKRPFTAKAHNRRDTMLGQKACPRLEGS